MYKIPYTGTRVVMKADRDATVNAAKTAWGRRRAEKFFARFLDEKMPVWLCNVLHPVASRRSSDFMWHNIEIEARSNNQNTGDNNLLCSKGVLESDELAYIRAYRKYYGILQAQYSQGSLKDALRNDVGRIEAAMKAESELNLAKQYLLLRTDHTIYSLLGW